MASKSIFEFLETKRTPRQWVLYFEFRIHDDRFHTANCMLVTILAQIINQSSENLETNKISLDGERLSSDTVWTDEEL
jgi:hypothetical protein